jgi:hypothetical protein
MRGLAVVLLGMVLGLSGCVVYDHDYEDYDDRGSGHWEGEHRHREHWGDGEHRRERWDGERHHERRWDDEDDRDWRERRER